MKTIIFKILGILIVECVVVYFALWNGHALTAYKLILTGAYSHQAWQELLYGLWWASQILLCGFCFMFPFAAFPFFFPIPESFIKIRQ